MTSRLALYRALLRVYSAAFRRRYGGELEGAFLAARADPRFARRAGELRFWSHILADLVASAARQRARQTAAAFRARRSSPHRSSKVDTMAQDLRQALRLVVRQPGFSAVAVLSLALGIGGSSLIYGLVDALVLHPFPYPDPDRLVAVGVTFPHVAADERFIEALAPAEYADLKASRSFARTTAFDLGNRNLAGGDTPERLFTALVLDDPFDIVGMPPILGRGFLGHELAPGGPPVAIISHRIWQSRFGGDRQIVGRTIRIGGQAATIVGVMPPGLLLLGTDLWIPWGGDQTRMPRNIRQFTVLARLGPHATLDSANAELAAIAGRVDQEFRSQFREYEGWRLQARPWATAVARDLRPAALVLFGAVIFVLLISCSNVANLLLTRAASRQREIAVRLALGAARWRVARELLAESLLLSIAGTSAGLLVAAWGFTAAPSLLPAQIAGMDPDIRLSGRVLVFGAALAILSAIAIALVPIVRAWRTAPRESLGADGRGATGGRATLRIRQAFIVAQVALAVSLLAGAGLLVRSFVRIQAVDLGFDPSNMLTMRLTLPREKYQGPAVNRFFNGVIDRVSALPGVERAAAASQFPPMGAFDTTFQVEGQEPAAGPIPNALITVATPGYFATLAVPLAAGRAFDKRDTARSPLVAIVNQAFAARFFRDTPNGREAPRVSRPDLGRRLRIGDVRSDSPSVEIVGVVADLRNRGPAAPVEPEIFIPMEQQSAWNQLFLLVRVRGDAAALLSAARREILTLDADQPVYAIRTMEEALRSALFPQRVSLVLIGAFAAIALALAAIGVYGVIAHGVVARTQEIGIRMALGADGGSIVRLVVRQALALVSVGLVIGLALALVAGRALATLLVDVTPRDPATLAAVSGLLALVGAAAGYLPARRAARVDPGAALRYE